MPDMNWKTAAGDTLRERRIAAGLSQRALARRARVQQTDVARIEAHRVQPTLPVLGRLLDALDTELRPVGNPPPDDGIAASVAAEIRGLVSQADLEPRALNEAFRAAAGIVDEAQRTTPNQFRRSVTKAPEPTGVPGFDALIASLVEDSCEKFGIDAPGWVDDDWRFVGEWFTSGVPEFREDALSESPPAFRRHGVYVLANEFCRA